VNYVLGWQQQLGQQPGGGSGSGVRMTAAEAVATQQTLGGIVEEEEEGEAATPSPLLLACLHLRAEVRGIVAAADEGALD